MNKGQLVVEVAKKANLSKKDAAKRRGLLYPKTIPLVGFGTFKVVRRKARIGRNPQTGEKIKIAAKNVVKFKPGKGF